jgi:FKBP-type peptidyl-prolyl cis-trans isomerase FklB
MSQEEIRATLTSLQQRLVAARQKELKEKAAKNTEEGKKFLAENQKKAGVKTLPSGLQYKVLTEGAGKTPKAEDTVTVNYKGTLIDGTEFDSSYKRGQPATFQVKGVIKGWTEALQLMKEGSKWHLFIPPELAYGERGAGRDIGPNATLIFEVELLTVK